MNFAAFHNALRILRSIDGDQFDAAMSGLEDGAIGRMPGAWLHFDDDPLRFFVRADDQTAQAIWRIIERRQTRKAA